MSDPDEWCFALDFLLDPPLPLLLLISFPGFVSARELARFPVCFRHTLTSAAGVGTSDFNLRDAT